MNERQAVYLKAGLIFVTTVPIGGLLWTVLLSSESTGEIIGDPVYWVSIAWIFSIVVPGFWFLESRGHLSERWY